MTSHDRVMLSIHKLNLNYFHGCSYLSHCETAVKGHWCIIEAEPQFQEKIEEVGMTLCINWKFISLMLKFAYDSKF